MEFKNKYPFLGDKEIGEYYDRLEDVPINTGRLTDLNSTSLQYIVSNIVYDGGGVLDVACGRGYLLNKLMETYPKIKCVGTDIILPPVAPQFKMIQADISTLPFEDHSFDTVICTHALEHIRNPKKALDELIRVTKHRLLIVVPRQREYVYTVDLHVNFFPYMYSFKNFISIENATYLDLKGDFLCRIDF
jgi:ubiquinone/menaquinone biosynthesis C-methylase UbiE